jgi:ATP-dependent helicase/nuclease subunit B
MTHTPRAELPRLVESLARAARKNRVGRKLVVAPNFSAGRELLRCLALSGDGWIGFEVTTPHRLAQRLALAKLEADGLRLLDPFEQQALLDEALDSVLPTETGPLAELSEGVGFRTRVHGAITALRLAGIGPRELDAAHFAQWEKRLFLLRVLQRYERLLSERRRADVAHMLHLALAALDDAGTRMPDVVDAETVLLVPGVGTRGLQGRLIAALGARGAKVLETDPVVGLDVPDRVLQGRNGGPSSAASYLYAPAGAVTGCETTQGASESESEVPAPVRIEVFAASSIDAELRDVLRRALDAGLTWDQVEIVATDAQAYGSALHALGRRLGIPVTYAVGLPIGRTRTGRVVLAYLDWIEEGFQAHVIRRLLEAGDLRPPRSKGQHAPAALARRFRSLRVGWGRKRYRDQIREALAGLDDLVPGKVESAEGFERRLERARSELEALKSILYPALKATPAVPDRMGDGGASVSPAELARGLGAFLRRVPRGRGPDRAAREEVGRILDRIGSTLHRRTEFRAAVSIVRAYLDIHVRPELAGQDEDGTGAPWSSMGGALHMSDLDHGGFTGRRAVFLVGLDAERIPGGGAQDPVLLDSDRRVLGHELPTATELMRERIFRFAALFARLRGTVTMSYGAWQATEARMVGPSSVMLQALRLSRGDPALTFKDLHEALGRVVSSVPRAGSPRLDSDDYWMAALGGGDVLQQGRAAVRASFPELDAGLSALELRSEGDPSEVHGVITARPAELDPRRNDSIVVSASRLEALGACPLRYLHGSVLRLYPPDDPELDPDAWLDARERGSLLHGVYDATLREAKDSGLKLDDPAFERLALDRLAEGLARLRAEVPIPGEGTLARETAALQEDVRSFVRMVRQQTPQYAALELRFGLGEDEPVVLDLSKGALRLRGAIDRVDQDLAGLHVIDYKTGAPYGYEKGVFDGGRRLQHAIYAHVAEERLQNDVVDGQYHFPTRRGQNQSFTYARRDLASVSELLDVMLDGVAAGHFVPTNDSNDCRFCDFSEVCRASRGEWGSTVSPLADWSEQHANTGVQPAFEQLKRARTFED